MHVLLSITTYTEKVLHLVEVTGRGKTPASTATRALAIKYRLSAIEKSNHDAKTALSTEENKPLTLFGHLVKQDRSPISCWLPTVEETPYRNTPNALS